MTPSAGSNEQQPIIIVRRRRAEEDGHHGGAWKIAFADFMTAMMALFLVLWLVNASDTDTRKAVASYFNPVKLVDRERSRRGLQSPDEMRKSDLGEDGTSGPVEELEPESGEAEEARFLDAPEAIMAEREAAALAASAGAADAVPFETSLAAELRPDDPFAAEVRGGPNPEAETVETTPSDPEPEPAAPAPSEPDRAAVAQDVAGDIAKAVAEALPGDGELAKAVRVVEIEAGTLVRLADGPGFAMFDAGSFVPTGRAVVAVKAIAAVLAGRDERVRVEGHTDSVPFRGAGDNWRLSTDRGHAARLMLARGGLRAGRIASVSGYAATRPLDGVAPEDARNRRIEILLERR